MMQVSKRIPFEDPQVLNTVRAVYIGSNVVIALIYVYIMAQINKKKGTCPMRRLRYARNLIGRHATPPWHMLTLYRHDHPQVCRARAHGLF